MAQMSNVRKVSDHSIIAISGEDATTFLQGLVTNGPPDNGGCLSALLTPQGKILFQFMLMKSDDRYLLSVHSNAAEAFIKRLKLYRLRAKVQIDEAPDFALFTDAQSADTATIEVSRTLPLGLMIAGAGFCDHAIDDTDYHQRRIAAGFPEWGADFDSNEVFPMDINYDLLGGVDYRKGCFVGQEVVSRMKRKGDARKRTLIANFQGEAPKKGAAVTAGDSSLGAIMSGVGGAALALIRLDRWAAAQDDGREILADGRTVTLTSPTYMDSK